MKRIISFLLALIMLFALSACGDKSGGGGSTEKEIPSKIQVETVDYYENNLLLPELESQPAYIDFSYGGNVSWDNFMDEKNDRENALLSLPFSISPIDDWKIKWDDKDRFSNFTLTRDNETIRGWKTYDVLGEFQSMRVSHEYVFEDIAAARDWTSTTNNKAKDWFIVCLKHFEDYDTFFGSSYELKGFGDDLFKISLDEKRQVHISEEVGFIDYSQSKDRFFTLPTNYDFFQTNGFGAGKNNEDLEEVLIGQAQYIKENYFYQTNFMESMDMDNRELNYTFDAKTNTLTAENPIRNFTISFERDDNNKISTAIFTEKTMEFTSLRDAETRPIATRLDAPLLADFVELMDGKNGGKAWSIDSVSVLHRSNLTYTVSTTFHRTAEETYYVEQTIRLDAKDIPFIQIDTGHSLY